MLIVAEGLPSEDLYILYSGWAFRFKTLSDGPHQILNFLLPGDFIGLQEKMANASPHGLEAITEVALCRFQRSGLWELYKKHPGLAYGVTWIEANQKDVIDKNLLSVARRNATERVATSLIQIFKRLKATKLARDLAIDFPFTQQHVADALGLFLVHTNKILRRLTKMRFHQISNGQLTVLNPLRCKTGGPLLS